MGNSLLKETGGLCYNEAVHLVYAQEVTVYWYVICGVIGIALLIFLIAFICFYRVFYLPKPKPLGEDEYPIPDGEIYEVFREDMVAWIKMTRAMPREKIRITSYDGTPLCGTYYECRKGAPLEILFHGYRGSAERDLSGGVERCFALGRNALIVDQRGSGESGGRIATFGIRERKDCLAWVAYACERFGEDTEIILTGISMGGATVLMAAGEVLPPNVVCILSDCGYSSPKAIICKVIRDMHLPAGLVYPFVKLGARLYGGFDLEETSPIEAVRRSRTPIILIHGDTDDFVPCDMSRELYEACTAEKSFLVIPGAGHGLAYPVDREKYLCALRDFEAVWRRSAKHWD